ncbi:MAG: hypothetical protein Q9191_001904 [Dirinaria sp. TL-2023a]
MAGQSMVPQGAQPQPGQQRNNVVTQQIAQRIFHSLQALQQQQQQQQPNLQGWQASFQLPQRVPAVTYEQQFKAKLGEIAQTRAGLAKNMQQQLQNSQPPQMGMAQPQAHMQAMVPNPNQISMQQRLASQQMARPNQQPMVGMLNQQQNLHMGNPQARFQLQNGQQKIPPQGQFSAQELEQISRLARNLFTNTPQDKLQQIRQGLNSTHPQQQQHLLAQGMDPVSGYFRELAAKQYMAMRNGSQRPGLLAQGPNTINGDQRPMSQNAMRTQPQQMGNIPAAQNIDPSFMGNVDHIHTQQRDAQRLQEAGQVVVPASNSQAIAEQQRAPGRPNSQQPNIQSSNRPPQTPNMSQQSQGFWNAQGQQQPAQSAPSGQIQNPPQANGFPSATIPGPAHLQGQVGGLNTPVRQMQHNMPHLNRGVGSQTQSSQPQTMWPQQGTPQMPQANPATPNAHQVPNGAPTRPVNNQQMQQYLQTLPEDERQKLLMQMQMQMQARQRASGQQQPGQAQPVRMQPQRSQAGQQLNGIQGLPRPANPAQQANGAQSQRAPGQQSGQPQIQPQQTDLNQAARQKQQQMLALNANNILTEENERLMDSYPFPHGILNANNALSRLPQAVKTWGHLKAWVRENASNLPRESEQKLRGLQGLHFQSISQRQQQPGMRPTAPMVPRPGNQAAHPQIPSIPQPTMQEIQQTRNHNPQLRGATDDQVKKAIMKQRYEHIQRARQQQGLNPQQQSQFMQRQQQAQFHQQQQTQSLQASAQATKPAQPALQRPTNQRPPQQPTQPNQQAAPKAAPQAPMQPNKGVKRSSTDDVVEVPDPKTAQNKSQAAKPAQQKSNPAAQAAKLQQTQVGQPDAKQQQMQRVQTTQGQPVNQPTKGAPAMQKSEEAQARLRELVNEVKQRHPLGAPVPMNAATRAKMVERLRSESVMQILSRMDKFLPLFFTMFKDENSTKEMIRARLLLACQYKDQNGTPSDHFTISAEELENCHNILLRFTQVTMQRVQAEKTNSQHLQQQQQQQQPQPPQPPAKETTSALSAANLRQHENNTQAARQLSQQRHHNSNRAPLAPTSDKPPYTFPPAQSPHGVPVYGPTELTADKLQLQLPVVKKRKGNNNQSSAASTPAQQVVTPMQKPSPSVSKMASPEISRPPAPTMIKCPIPHCQHPAGFVSQADLDKHILDVHEPKEPVIDDPFQYALEQMRFALNLDKNGKQVPKAGTELPNAKIEALAMKGSASSQGQAMKQESATPMSRVPTQTDPSPASNLLKTPQIANMKTPASDSKALQNDSANQGATPLIITPDANDPWSASLVSPETIREAFSGLAHLNGPKSWTKIQDYHLTPESMSSENTEKNSPRPSDISENDAVKINMELEMGAEDKGWIPISWGDPMMQFEGLDLGPNPFDLGTETLGEGQDLFGGDSGLGIGSSTTRGGALMGDDLMDWETMFGETAEQAEDAAKKAQKKYLKDPFGPTDEWLKVYGPGQAPKR